MRTLVTQSRMASLIASLSVFEPELTPRTSAPSRRMRIDIQFLPPHVFFAHVDDAFHAEECAHRGGRNAMLACAGFGDDAMLAHASGKQPLAETVVDLVRSGMQQVFALEINLCSAKLFRQAFGMVERCGSTGVIVQQRIQLEMEVRISLRFRIRCLKFLERSHQRLRNIASAIHAESSRPVHTSCSCTLLSCRQ